MLTMTPKVKKDIEAILKDTKMSKGQKIWRLYLMGLTTSDIDLYDKERYFETFGVEIECFVNKAEVLRWANVGGLKVKYESYNHLMPRSETVMAVVSMPSSVCPPFLCPKQDSTR